MPLPRRTRTRGGAVIGFLVALVMGVLFMSWDQGDTTTYPRWESPAAQSSTSTDPESGLPVVRLADLPAEAREAVERIEAGGPYPYDEDDGVFQNREELLPDRAEGHYREYTVGGRPGDRGPLRIVAGDDGELYWTDDHYRSLSRIGR